jgi:ankyrin repeat protein
MPPPTRTVATTSTHRHFQDERHGDVDGLHAMLWLTACGSTGVTGDDQLLLAASTINVNIRRSTDGQTALHVAGALGCTAYVMDLIKHGAGVNTRDDDGHTALQLACAADGDCASTVQALLAVSGINVNSVTDWGAFSETALHLACNANNTACAEALIQTNMVDVNLQNRPGFTPLVLATVAPADIGLIRPLLAAKGVHVNTASHTTGLTALHIASAGNDTDAVHALLMGGGCRFKQTTASGSEDVMLHPTVAGTLPFGLATETAVRQLFLAGVDYWQRKNHAHHSWAMKQVVRTVLRIRQRQCRSGSPAAPHPRGRAAAEGGTQRLPPPMPAEMWMEVLRFLRSADFDRSPAATQG